MTIEEQAEEYLHHQFITLVDPNFPDRKPTEEDWQRMPPEVKKQMVDLIIGFDKSPIVEKIRARLKLKDNELGMYVKDLLK